MQEDSLQVHLLAAILATRFFHIRSQWLLNIFFLCAIFNRILAVAVHVLSEHMPL